MSETFHRLIAGGALLVCTVPASGADSAQGIQAFQHKDYAAAFREWKPAADQGQPEAQYNLGILYLRGLGVQKDAQEAFRLFHAAADRGLVDAQFQVGLMREKGTGVQQNYGEAQHWYALSAARGDSEAETALAGLYEQGYGVQKDLALAVYWYSRAAEQGHVSAQARLGACYAGKSSGHSLEKAYFWLTLAAKEDPDAAKLRSQIASKLTPEQISRAEASAAAWKPASEHPQKSATVR